MAGINSLQQLVTICKSLKENSSIILRTNLDVLRRISKKDSAIVEKFKEFQIDDQFYSTLQNIALEFINDAKNVNKEIDNFILENDQGLFAPNDSCTFLMSVWSGDEFGEPRIEGLRLLNKELEDKRNSSLLDYCLKQYREQKTA